MLSWYVTESGTVSVWLLHGDSEGYRLTDHTGRQVAQGDLKNGRVTFVAMTSGRYVLHVTTAKGTIRKEIDI